MPLLRITQERIAEKQYRVRVELEEEGQARQTVDTDFEFELTPEDHERIRWYLEDYLQYPQDPAPTIAANVEKQIEEIGAVLFKVLFKSNDDASDLWAILRGQLNETRVEVVAGIEEATAIPWELVRDPKTNVALALRAESFVRSQPQAAQGPKLPKVAEEGEGPIRILLVICRPGGRKDVPFRSVASRLIKGLNEDDRKLFKLDVLRPATFESLSAVLREAKANDQPYHVVHFDGHGMYTETPDTSKAAEWLKKLGMVMLSGPRAGSHGYLLFENAEAKENIELVDGPTLGNLLVETDVGVLVLNACRSAHAEVRTQPGPAGAGQEDPHGKVRALGSLAQEVMDAGMAGVVAMRYNVYVVTAAEFVANLYGALTRGQSLGEAVTLGRKQLAAEPLREIAFEGRPLQDWCVPVVYEAAPIRLFPKAKSKVELKIKLAGAGATAAVSEESKLDSGLPKTPDVGFLGRDETLLALDRAFDRQSIVLLHAYAGSGKTATAAEFARWYTLTGGLGGGQVLFTSFFERKVTLRDVLSHFGQMFGPVLEQVGVNWSAITEVNQMRDVAVQVLKQVPTLWIWDNVEPVAGFPAGTKSAWSKDEQKELADFLRDARGTKARFLLTSRRDERKWLGDLPMRITIPPMPMQERVQLARALADKYGRRLEDVEDWRPLLNFTQGNPLTITVLVGQALREGLKSKEDIEGFVEKLRKGEAAFADEASEGRSKSLGASLNYGFEQAFGEDERKQLALLHLFQGFVNVGVLKVMGNPKDEWCLPEVKGLTREAGTKLLNKAAEIGLLTAHSGGYYSIHPAVPWFFKELFDTYYSESAQAATRAFVEAISVLGSYYDGEYDDGKRDVVYALKAEEGNLLQAWRLALANGCWEAVIRIMRALDHLYTDSGRYAEWANLVNETAPYFVDFMTNKSLPGKEHGWEEMTHWRASLARRSRHLEESEKMRKMIVDKKRQYVMHILTKPIDSLDSSQMNDVVNFAIHLMNLGIAQFERLNPDCVAVLKESFELCKKTDHKRTAADCAFNLGHVYTGIVGIQDLNEAKRWYEKSLELREEHDRSGRGLSFHELGQVAYARFQKGLASGEPEKRLVNHLNEAIHFALQALETLPSDDVTRIFFVHHLLGNIYDDAGQLEEALSHYREALNLSERQMDDIKSALLRREIARALLKANRYDDALLYAQGALKNIEKYGDGAAEDIRKTQGLIAEIEKDMKSSKEKGSK